MQVFVGIDQLTLKVRNKAILTGLCWQIKQGEQWLLSGKSGSGKTMLAKAIAGFGVVNGKVEINYNQASTLPAAVSFVPQWFTFKDKQGSSNFYFQQRFNSADAENTLTVWESITAYATKLHKSTDQGEELLRRFKLWARKDAALIQLSSGEHKKLQLIKALLYSPQFLILDNPYTGLDVESRATLNQYLNVTCAAGVQLLIISNDAEVPTCINRFATIINGELETSLAPIKSDKISPLNDMQLPAFFREPAEVEQDELIHLRHVNISYGEKQILKNLNWQIKKGDRWHLKGPNGSGKSTLISLLTGDNPQAYSQDIHLFGKKRGTGESIWDIKKHIGFISPELQWYFEPSSTVFQAVASGLFDTAGLFRKLSIAQTERIHELLHFFELSTEADYLLTQLSLGNQRLVLLARAIIKNPPLLILDEPCQGLDEAQTNMFNNLVDKLCTGHRSLIYVSHFESRLPKFLTHQLSLKEGIAVSIEPILENEITT
jgi:molybdate transport system ATP-binding protein